MSAVEVRVHLEVDRFDPELSEAVRVSRAGRPDVLLPVAARHRGVWDSDAAELAAVRLALRHGLAADESATARTSEAAWVDETADPRWHITFETLQ